MRAALLSFWLGLIAALPVAAHEFWIDPLAFRIAPGDTLQANIRVGEELDGAAYAYVPPNFKRFEFWQNGTRQMVEGRAGDRPALTMPVVEQGLGIIVHQTKDYLLTYTEWEKFIAFVEHKDFATALSDHVARGLSQERFRERYSRYAKSLVAIGDGIGADRNVGLETEIIAEANPYTDDLSAGLPVRVLWNDAPRADAQVELFEKAPDGSVAVTLHRTDAEGRAVLPVKRGHSYLVDAVVLQPLEPEGEFDPVWETLWASLTFAVPDR